MKLVKIVGDEREIDYLGEIIKEADLNKKNEKLYEIELAETYDYLTDNKFLNLYTGEIMVDN